MKTVLICTFISVMLSIPQESGLLTPSAIERLGGWAVVAGLLAWQTKQHGRAITALERSVEQNGRVLKALEKHMEDDVRAFERLRG